MLFASVAEQYPGVRKLTEVKTGDRDDWIIGEWESMEVLVIHGAKLGHANGGYRQPQEGDAADEGERLKRAATPAFRGDHGQRTRRPCRASSKMSTMPSGCTQPLANVRRVSVLRSANISRRKQPDGEPA